MFQYFWSHLSDHGERREIGSKKREEKERKKK
jgi:hypothetical protein